MAAGAIDSLANNVVQVLLIVVLLIFGESNVNLGLSAPSSDSGPGRLLWILVGVVVVTALVIVFVGKVHGRSSGGSRSGGRDSRRNHRAPGGGKAPPAPTRQHRDRAPLSAALGVFARALGYPIPFGEIVLINESVALLSSFIPVPGGIGVVEYGLTIGLTSAGMSRKRRSSS